MVALGNHAFFAAVTLLSATELLQRAEAHPGCANNFVLSLTRETVFCPTDEDDLYANGVCCDAAKEAEIVGTLDASDTTGTCAQMYKEVLCTACHPYSLHLYERLGNGLTMTKDFCDEFYDACSGQLNLSSNYCNLHAGESEDEPPYWAYPLVIPDETFDGELVEAFTDINPPDQPIDMRMTPDGTKWWIVGLEGEIVEMDVSDPESPPSSTKLVLDISGDDNLLLSAEEGLFSIAFSPGFHTTGVFYASYSPPKRAGSLRGFNRLSRFQYDPSNPGNTRDSEEVIIDSVDKNFVYHAAGWIGFKPSAYENSDPSAFHDLYWSMGDSGNQLDDSKQAQNPDTQHGSILRISVDSNTGSNYKIPNGNPFKNGGGLAEICAQGFRNPHKCSFDRANDELWCGDVGNYEVESIKKITCGNNYGWRQYEGHRCTLEIDDPSNEFSTGCNNPASRNPYTFPEFSYCHPDYYSDNEPDYAVPDIPNDNFCGDRSVVGSAIIGGFVYRGFKYGDLLGGSYVFADYTQNTLYYIYPKGGGWGTDDGDKYGYGVIKGGAVKAVSFAEANNGELYIISRDGKIYELPCGDLCTEPIVQDFEELGCAEDFDEPDRIMPVGPIESDDGVMSAAVCHDICAEELPGFQYFGTQYSFQCFCAKSLPGSVTFNHNGCTNSCKGTSGETCGGSYALTVYQIGDDVVPPTPAPTPEVEEGDYGELGCAQDFADDGRVMPVGPIDGQIMSAEICYGICAVNLPGFEYFGTQYSFQCFCSKSLPGSVTFDYNGCNMSCKGTSGETCGGSYALTVYEVGDDVVAPTPAPTPDAEEGDYGELGCAADLTDGVRVMPVGPIAEDVMSAEICLGICADELPGFEYFGTQYSFECFCSKSLPGSVTFDHNGCNKSCKGNSGETCGGTNALTVYQIGDDVVAPTPAPTPEVEEPTPAPTTDVEEGEYGELGCAVDLTDDVRVMPVGPIDADVMSADICYGICAEQLPGFEYFGTQYSFECFCAETLPGDMTFDHNGCTSACKGNSGETCGGSNALTVYQIGDDVIAPTPAPTPEVEEPTPAPTPEAEEEDYGELGCAADFTEGVRIMPVGPINGGVMSAEICFGICAEQLSGFQYFGTQYSFECFCAETLPSYVSFDHNGCTSTCKGTSGETCGGTDALTVYQIGDDVVAPTPAPTPEVEEPTPAPTPEEEEGEYEELGCAADLTEGVRVMPVGPIDGDVMSAEICYGICAEELPGFEYFGTQYSFECFCAKNLPGYVTFDHNGCTSTCKGNSGETCGGSNALTIFQVGDGGPTPDPTPAPVTEGSTCTGIPAKEVCCPTTCGSCAGSGCSGRNGGEDFTGGQACCASGVRALGRVCSASVGPPCVVV